MGAGSAADGEHRPGHKEGSPGKEGFHTCLDQCPDHQMIHSQSHGSAATDPGLPTRALHLGLRGH